MEKYFDYIQDSEGNVISSASIKVKDYPSGALSTIYSDDGVTEIDNINGSYKSDATGYFEFYAADGAYTIEISGDNLATTTIQNILLEDPADASPASFTLINATDINTSTVNTSGAVHVGTQLATQDASIKLGLSRTDNGASYIDIIGDTINTLYGLRIVRNGGVNANSGILHKGIGHLVIDAQDAGSKVAINVGGVGATQFDNSINAGETRMLVFDVDNGLMQRVTVGVADSGGTGYKVLRIPN